MAMFMQVRREKNYRVRRDVSNCKQLLRFENESVNFLVNEFLPVNEETRGGALTSRKRMEILLRSMGDPGFQVGVAEDLGVDRTTVCKTIDNVMDKILLKASDWIKFPSTIQEVNAAKVQWHRRFRLPTVIGSLDCTHVEIKKPSVHGDEYVNRKGYASINVQATVNANEEFTSLSAEWPGSVHDARIWRRSPIRDIVSKYNGDACLLGDSGYGISPWLITPFKPPRNDVQRNFNLIHARERVIIERTFGQLKKRFPIVGNCVRVSLSRVPKVIATCAVLHNVAKHLNDQFEYDLEFGDEAEEEYDDEALIEQQENRASKVRGEQKRLEMMEFVQV